MHTGTSLTSCVDAHIEVAKPVCLAILKYSRSDTMITMAQVKEMENFDTYCGMQGNAGERCSGSFYWQTKAGCKGWRQERGRTCDSVGRQYWRVGRTEMHVLKNFSACEFGFSKYLWVLKDESEIIAVDDIGDVQIDAENNDEKTGDTLTQVTCFRHL